MAYPKFFDSVEDIVMFDPLAKILGSISDGIITFKYKNIVEMAGHSCPTVAGAYLMTYKALKALYTDDIPVRGELKIQFKENLNEGVAGVIANVMSNITGATELSGFKGLNGKYARNDLMEFGCSINSNARFTRLDLNTSVDVYYNPSIVPAGEKMMPLMKKTLMGLASEEETVEFGWLWQERVKAILIDNFNNDELMSVKQL